MVRGGAPDARRIPSRPAPLRSGHGSGRLGGEWMTTPKKAPVTSEKAVSKKAVSKKAEAQHRNRPRTARLSYDDWVNGALDLLGREGVTAIRIPRLCEE